MANEPIILVNSLKVAPENQAALIALLKKNVETVISTLEGWCKTRLIAAKDGTGVIIYSEWETEGAVAGMRNDPRMLAYFPKILELAKFESMVGETVFSHIR